MTISHRIAVAGLLFAIAAAASGPSEAAGLPAGSGLDMPSLAAPVLICRLGRDRMHRFRVSSLAARRGGACPARYVREGNRCVRYMVACRPR